MKSEGWSHLLVVLEVIDEMINNHLVRDKFDRMVKQAVMWTDLL